MIGPWWIVLGSVAAVIGLAASLIGIFVPATYQYETSNWAGQAIGQDIANVIAFTALLLLARSASRGSLRAVLCCAGVIAYGIYAYAIYAFTIHFGPLFLAYVAVLGLSVYALIGLLHGVNASAVKAAFRADAPLRSTAGVVAGIGVLFALLWLSEIGSATLSQSVPASLRVAGIASNPVYVLDLALLLPAAVVGGTLLIQRRPWGYVVAPILLTVLALLSVGIVAGFVVLAARGEIVPRAVGVFLAALALCQLGVLLRFVRATRDDTRSTVTTGQAAYELRV